MSKVCLDESPGKVTLSTGNESLVTAVELAALGVGGWLIAAAAEVKEA